MFLSDRDLPTVESSSMFKLVGEVALIEVEFDQLELELESAVMVEVL